MTTIYIWASGGAPSEARRGIGMVLRSPLVAAKLKSNFFVGRQPRFDHNLRKYAFDNIRIRSVYTGYFATVTHNRTTYAHWARMAHIRNSKKAQNGLKMAIFGWYFKVWPDLEMCLEVLLVLNQFIMARYVFWAKKWPKG